MERKVEGRRGVVRQYIYHDFRTSGSGQNWIQQNFLDLQKTDTILPLWSLTCTKENGDGAARRSEWTLNSYLLWNLQKNYHTYTENDNSFVDRLILTIFNIQYNNTILVKIILNCGDFSHLTNNFKNFCSLCNTKSCFLHYSDGTWIATLLPNRGLLVKHSAFIDPV